MAEVTGVAALVSLAAGARRNPRWKDARFRDTENVAPYRRLIGYEEFTQRVRRHRPSELLPALAKVANTFFEQEVWRRDRVRLPWSIGGAAKASLVYGNEHRGADVTDKDVFEICSACNALRDPLTRSGADLSDTVGAFLVRVAHEQFGVQQSYFEEISRLGALFEELDQVHTKVLTDATLETALGCSVEDFTKASFVLAVSARVNNGFFDPEWPSLYGADGIDQHLSMDVVRQVFADHFVTDVASVRSESAVWQQRDDALRQHEFNPLTAKPFVVLPDGRFVAPQPHYVFQRIAPSTVYYAGVKAFGNDFATDLGFVFEHYVGRQLVLLPDCSVHPEIVFGNNERSVDWFVVWGDLLLLIESKATRLTNRGRMGGNDLEGEVDRCLGKAYKQIERTSRLLDERHPAFSHLPWDRPRLAMVVTFEPYWAGNSTLLQQRLLPEAAIPTTIASIREFEMFVDTARVLSGCDVLRDVLQDPERRSWNLANALPLVDTGRNAILESAWERLAWVPEATPTEGPGNAAAGEAE